MKDLIDIDYLATLANIKLTKKEKRKFKEELTDILNFINTIQKVETQNILPTFQVTQVKNISRPDRKMASLPLRKVLKNASQKKDNYFKALKIIGDE